MCAENWFLHKYFYSIFSYMRAIFEPSTTWVKRVSNESELGSVVAFFRVVGIIWCQLDKLGGCVSEQEKSTGLIEH